MVQVAIKFLIRSFDITILVCLRDGRLTNFQGSLLSRVETSLHESSIFLIIILI